MPPNLRHCGMYKGNEEMVILKQSHGPSVIMGGQFLPFLQLFYRSFPSLHLALTFCLLTPSLLATRDHEATYNSRASVSDYKSFRRCSTFYAWPISAMIMLRTLGLTCIYTGDATNLPLSCCS